MHADCPRKSHRDSRIYHLNEASLSPRCACLSEADPTRAGLVDREATLFTSMRDKCLALPAFSLIDEITDLQKQHCKIDVQGQYRVMLCAATQAHGARYSVSIGPNLT